MSEYLTESAYQRWLRKYQINYRYCLDLLSNIRLRLDVLPYEYEEEIKEIEEIVEELEERLEEARPRNFNLNSDPLMGMEKFIENFKVLLNLITRVYKKEDQFSGIYQSEMDRVLAIHKDYKFKDKLKDIRERIEKIENKTLPIPEEVLVQEKVAS